MLESGITLLRATPAHLELARQAVAEINLPTSHHSVVDDAAVTEFLADPGHYLLLAVEEGRAVGSLYGYALRHPYRREPQFFLYGIDVRPGAAGRGVGKALVMRFIAEARLASAFEVWVITNQANAAAMAIFQRNGLRRSATDDVVLSLAPIPDSDAGQGSSTTRDS
jgi:GNAT superfamily N-acetyltransferase